MKIPSFFAAGFPSLSAKVSLLLAVPFLLGTASVSTLSSADAPFTFSNTGSLNTGRSLHTATLLPNGKVLVAGGDGSGGFSASAELYDPASGTWTATGSLNTARHFYTAALLPNSNILIVRGRGTVG